MSESGDEGDREVTPEAGQVTLSGSCQAQHPAPLLACVGQALATLGSNDRRPSVHSGSSSDQDEMCHVATAPFSPVGSSRRKQQAPRKSPVL